MPPSRKPKVIAIEAEALDPQIIIQTSKALSSVVHNDEYIPAGSDAVRMLLNLTYNGESMLVRRAAALEMAAWIRRMSAVVMSYKHALHTQAEIISEKAKDFPGAEDVNKACLEAYKIAMKGAQGAMIANEQIAFTEDLSEALGIKDFIREQINNLYPNPTTLHVE